MSVRERENAGEGEGGVRRRGRQKPDHAKSYRYDKSSELHLLASDRGGQ